MSEIRKNFYKRLIYIALSSIPIILTWNDSGWLRYIGLAGFVLGMLQVLALIRASPFIVDDFFPPKTRFEHAAKPFDRFMYPFASLFFFAGLVCLIFEIRQIDNTIFGTKLFWYSGLVGITLAALATLFLKAKHPSVYHESKRRFTVHFGLFVGFFLLAAAAGSFINHFFAAKDVICKMYPLDRKSMSHGKSTSYFLFLKMENGKEERFDISQSLYDEVSDNTPVQVCTKKGKLGFDVVTSIKAVNE